VIPRRLLLACGLASGFVAAAAVTVVSGLLAALAALEPLVGAAGAAALIALVVAGCLSLPAVFGALRGANRSDRRARASTPEVLSSIWVRIKARPFLTSGLGALGLLLVVLKPRYLGAILRAWVRETGRASR
jgi:hypothetical protein